MALVLLDARLEGIGSVRGAGGKGGPGSRIRCCCVEGVRETKLISCSSIIKCSLSLTALRLRMAKPSVVANHQVIPLLTMVVPLTAVKFTDSWRSWHSPGFSAATIHPGIGINHYRRGSGRNSNWRSEAETTLCMHRRSGRGWRRHIVRESSMPGCS